MIPNIGAYLSMEMTHRSSRSNKSQEEEVSYKIPKKNIAMRWMNLSTTLCRW